jgi:hypothetical protein
MIIKTASGNITINKKSAYGKWLMGWISEGGFTGTQTLTVSWDRAITLKPSGCSWYSLGALMVSEQRYGKGCEDKE